jgi:diguanylate cyclase (GGDEF)-like protein
MQQLTRREWIFLIGLPLGTYVIAHLLDLNEHFQVWVEAHEGLEIDEILIVPIGFALALIGVLINHVHRLNRAAHFDVLTGLPNRRAFLDALNRQIDAGGSRYALLFLDLDGFKEINDRHGHREGDWVLQEVSMRIHARVPSQAIVSRFGGDEFCALLPGISDAEPAIEFAERIADALQEPLHIEGSVYYITASIGIVIGSPLASETADPLRDADLAMYAAKRSGRASTVVFQPSMRPST